ncbi:hypothetical protein Glove_46g13 [Diversispora epigaea]|uniref:RING-type domain-containing protein n=1 Tax=Diversispora epigaea TaxID=1348612 RepID=A0A397JP86_9GLOM|nr:hypothetical protein Glove_46g13 [Diversispora epigaea]
MTLINLQNFALNILKETKYTFPQNTEVTELAPCLECEKKILTISYEPFTILACGHIYHRKCIEKKFLLTKENKCPFSGSDKVVDPVVYERRFSQQSSQSSTSSIVRRMSNQLQINSPAIQEDDEMEYAEEIPAIENSPNLNSKKHTSEPSKKLSIKKVKIPVKKEKSPILKKLIEELTSTVSEKSEKVTEVDENNANFLFHYNKITYAESKNEIANREVIECYFNFGEAMRKRFEHYRNLNHGERACLALINEEIRKQIPDDITNDAMKKRKEKAGKIYDLFDSISKVKIRSIKSFSVSSISNLSQDNINYVIAEILKRDGKV